VNEKRGFMKRKYFLCFLLLLSSLSAFAQAEDETDYMENPDEEQSFEAPVRDEVRGNRGLEREPGGEFMQMPAQEQEFDPTQDDVDYTTPEEDEYAEDINY
jgi:hypothetical protein